jgi:hypothetical protein
VSTSTSTTTPSNPITAQENTLASMIVFSMRKPQLSIEKFLTHFQVGGILS